MCARCTSNAQSGVRRLRPGTQDRISGLRDRSAQNLPNVEFLFTTRQDDATTAFEAGAFRYGTIDKAGVSTPSYACFEALLVKTGAGWQMVMGRQLEAITESEWNALPR